MWLGWKEAGHGHYGSLGELGYEIFFLRAVSRWLCLKVNLMLPLGWSLALWLKEGESMDVHLSCGWKIAAQGNWWLPRELVCKILCLGNVWVICPKVSLRGGLQLRLRLREGDSVEVQSLCATGKVSAREFGYEILSVWDVWRAIPTGSPSSKAKGWGRKAAWIFSWLGDGKDSQKKCGLPRELEMQGTFHLGNTWGFLPISQLSLSIRFRTERGRNHGAAFDRMEREAWVAEGAWRWDMFYTLSEGQPSITV